MGRMIGVDVGGTFTDVVAVTDGQIVTIKVPTDVRTTEQGVIAGAREAGVSDATLFNHASTHGLNAVITRRLPKVAFLTTMGHRDMLDGGRVVRPAAALTDPHWRRSFGDAAKPLVPRYLRRGIRERITIDNGVLIALDEEQAREQLRVLKRCDVAGVAICLLNSYIDGSHERQLRELVAQELGPIPCSISSEISPLAKEYARASTTVVDVFMRIIYGTYTDRLQSGLRDHGFRGVLNYANCAAQLLPADVAMERPYEIVFAGPAAGTIASAHFGARIDVPNMICADVGGTSCDFSLVIDGKALTNTSFELEHDLIVNALSTEVHSIGAGGGSLVSINSGGAIEVGPGSAGSDPGPACYGRGGTIPATTDAYLMMGVIDPDGFAAGRLKLDPELSRQAFERLDTSLSLDQRIRYAFNVGINNIAEGVVNIGVRHGIDPRDFALMAFGAAGPMMLPAVLDLVNCAECIVPPHPGLFSALGLVSSDQVYGDSRSAYIDLTPDSAPALNAIFGQMEDRLRQRLGGKHPDLLIARSFDGRLVGQTWETPFIPVPGGTIDDCAVAQMIANFHESYKGRTGNRFDALGVQSVTYRVEAIIAGEKVDYPRVLRREPGRPQPTRTVTLRYVAEEPLPAMEYDRANLCEGDEIIGPAIIREALSTTFMLPGQMLRVGQFGELRIRKVLGGHEG